MCSRLEPWLEFVSTFVIFVVVVGCCGNGVDLSHRFILL